MGGLSSEEARVAARRGMGNITRAREEARAVWVWPWLESVGQDVRFAVRALVRQPGFTLLSVIVLGLAIGLNTSVFTVFAGAALRPMTGVLDPDRLAVVSGRVPQVPMGHLFRRLRYWLRDRCGRSAQEKLVFHRITKQHVLEANGLSAHDAHIAERCAMGKLTLARHNARAVWIWP